MSHSVFGVIGLGVMGKSISLNIAERGFPISVYNRIEEGEGDVVVEFLKQATAIGDIVGFTELAGFVESIRKPRRILLMIKAGAAVDIVIDNLSPLLSEGDVIIDGGNSHYIDSNRRSRALSSVGIHFIGSGISGGEEGARKGPSIMPGGSYESYKLAADVLEAISAKDKNGKPCCTYIGPGGAGHFVKMVHNGIEYAEMQLLAEVYMLLAKTKSYHKIADLFSQWNEGKHASYLLDITSKIFRKEENGEYLLDMILDKAGNKGTGSWSSKAALDLGMPNTLMASAVFARYISFFKTQRKSLSDQIHTEDPGSTDYPDLELLGNAYHFVRLINHHQGFELMRQASDAYGWQLNLAEIARIWTNGCIIRSKLLEESISWLGSKQSFFEKPEMINWLNQNETAIQKVLIHSMQNRVPSPVLTSAYQYWISMSTARLPANLIQAQRDFFGAHTYQRIDKPVDKFFHTNWE